MDTLRRQLIASPVYERLRSLGTPKALAESLAYEFADTFGDRALICVGDHQAEPANYDAQPPVQSTVIHRSA